MKTLRQSYSLLLLATATFLISSAHADVQVSAPERQQIWALAQDIVAVGIRKDFKSGEVSNRELIQFGIYRIALRQYKLFQDDKLETTMRISAKIVAANAMRYFGKTPQHQSVQSWKYRGGSYHGSDENFEQLGDQEIKGFRIAGANKNRLTVYVNYVHPMATTDAGQDIIVRTKMIFKPALSNGKPRYILDSFTYLTPNP